MRGGFLIQGKCIITDMKKKKSDKRKSIDQKEKPKNRGLNIFFVSQNLLNLWWGNWSLESSGAVKVIKSAIVVLFSLFTLLVIWAFYLIITEKSTASIRTGPKSEAPKSTVNFNVLIIPDETGFREYFTLTGSVEENVIPRFNMGCFRKLFIEVTFIDIGKPERVDKYDYSLANSSCNTNTNSLDEATNIPAPGNPFQLQDSEGFWYGSYPFDSHKILIKIWFEGLTPSGEIFYEKPDELHVKINTPNWTVKTDEQDADMIQGDNLIKVRQFSFDLQRHASIKVISVLLLSSMFFVILMVVFVPDTSNALEITVGILLGLWGIQEIIIPPNIRNQSPIHEAFFFLYLFFAWVILLRFIFIPAIKKLATFNNNSTK